MLKISDIHTFFMPPWRRKCEKDCSVIISCGAEGDEKRVEIGGPWCLSVELVSVWRGEGTISGPSRLS